MVNELPQKPFLAYYLFVYPITGTCIILAFCYYSSNKNYLGVDRYR